MRKVIYVDFNNKKSSEVDRVIEKAMNIIETLVREKHNLIKENKRLKNKLFKKLE